MSRALLHLRLRGLHHVEVFLDHRRGLRSERLHVRIAAVLRLGLERGQILLVVFHHRVDVILVEVRIVQVFHLPPLFGQVDAVLRRDRHHLGVRFAVVRDHRAADLFHIGALAFLLGHLPHVDFHHAALGRLFHKGFVLVAERRRCRALRRLFGLLFFFLGRGLSGNAKAKPGADQGHYCHSREYGHLFFHKLIWLFLTPVGPATRLRAHRGFWTWRFVRGLTIRQLAARVGTFHPRRHVAIAIIRFVNLL